MNTRESIENRIGQEPKSASGRIALIALTSIWFLFLCDYYKVFGGYFEMTNPNLQVACLWYFFLFPWVWVWQGFYSGETGAKIFAAIAVIPMCVFLLVGTSFVVDANREARGYPYNGKELMSIKQMDSRTSLCTYRWSASALDHFHELVQTETNVVPGLVFISVLKDVPYR